MALVLYYRRKDVPWIGYASLLKRELTDWGMPIVARAIAKVQEHIFGEHYSFDDIDSPDLVLEDWGDMKLEEPNRAIARCILEKRPTDIIGEAVGRLDSVGKLDRNIIWETIKKSKYHDPEWDNLVRLILQ